MLEILIQKRSFQKYLIVYAIEFTWICFFVVFRKIMQVNVWMAYYIPIIIILSTTLIVVVKVLKISLLQKHGKIMFCRIIHSATDFGNNTIHIRCVLDRNAEQPSYFEEIVQVPFLSTVPEIDSIYKNAKRYSDIENIEVLVDPSNYNRYEILYFKLLTDECRKSKYQIFLLSVLFVIVGIFISRLVTLR